MLRTTQDYVTGVENTKYSTTARSTPLLATAPAVKIAYSGLICIGRRGQIKAQALHFVYRLWSVFWNSNNSRAMKRTIRFTKAASPIRACYKLQLPCLLPVTRSRAPLTNKWNNARYLPYLSHLSEFFKNKFKPINFKKRQTDFVFKVLYFFYLQYREWPPCAAHLDVISVRRGTGRCVLLSLETQVILKEKLRFIVILVHKRRIERHGWRGGNIQTVEDSQNHHAGDVCLILFAR